MLWLSTDIDSRVAWMYSNIPLETASEVADTPRRPGNGFWRPHLDRDAEMLFEGAHPAAWTLSANVVIDWRRIVVGLLSGCSPKDSREDGQN